MEEEKLAPEVEEELDSEEEESSTSGDGSLDDDFRAAFGESSEDETEDGSEDTRETIDRVFEEGKKEQGEKDPIKDQKPPEELQPQVAKQEVSEDGVTPPQRLSANEKKIFSNIKSKSLRKGIQRMFKEHEAGQTKLINQERARLHGLFEQERGKLHRTYTEETQKVQSIRAAVEPHVDRLTFGGRMPISQAIGELATTHAKLTSDDPTVALGELKRISDRVAKRFNRTAENAFQNIDTSAQEATERESRLQKEIDDLKLQLGQVRAQPHIDRVRAEVDSARQERGVDGRLLYPELHDVNFLVQVNPLVEQIMRANPRLNYGEAHKQAVLIRRGQPQNHQQVPRLPAAATQTNGNKPSGVSSGSVRGRSASPNGKFDIVKDAPKTGSIHDDWEYVRRSM